MWSKHIVIKRVYIGHQGIHQFSVLGSNLMRERERERERGTEGERGGGEKGGAERERERERMIIRIMLPLLTGSLAGYHKMDDMNR